MHRVLLRKYLLDVGIDHNTLQLWARPGLEGLFPQAECPGEAPCMWYSSLGAKAHDGLRVSGV